MASAPHVQAQISIPAGASVQLGGASTALGCSDLLVTGSLTPGAGSQITQVRNLQVAAGGQLDLSGAQPLTLAQNYSNQGRVIASNGQILRVDSVACPAQGALGNVVPTTVGPTTNATPVPATSTHLVLMLAVAMAGLGAHRLRRRTRYQPN